MITAGCERFSRYLDSHFPSVKTQREILYPGPSFVAVVRRLEPVCQDGGDWREWHDLADQLLVSAASAASKI